MVEKLRESKSWQLVVVLVLILVVPLAVDINGRISVIRRMRQEEARLEQEMAAAEAEHEALLAELESVETDTYLERWARVEARMTWPGEVTVIPLFTQSSGEPISTLEDAPVRANTPPSISEQWHRLFFGADATH